MLQREVENENKSIQGLPTKRNAIIGAWAPLQMPLEKIKSTEQQEKSYESTIRKGFRRILFSYDRL